MDVLGHGVDLAKYNIHHDTTNYVSKLLVNKIMPMIIMPYRITTKSASIIDYMRVTIIKRI